MSLASSYIAAHWADVTNGVFEGGIGLLSWLNVKAIRRDKHLAGVNWYITGWATAWGFYNLYYYPHLGQWYSFSGGCIIFAGNLTWLCHVAYYARRGNRNGK